MDVYENVCRRKGEGKCWFYWEQVIVSIVTVIFFFDTQLLYFLLGFVLYVIFDYGTQFVCSQNRGSFYLVSWPNRRFNQIV